eukprot:COSAG01_NODE_12240_length_1775_cov_3.566702_1_plen_111_part_00
MVVSRASDSFQLQRVPSCYSRNPAQEEAFTPVDARVAAGAPSEIQIARCLHGAYRPQATKSPSAGADADGSSRLHSYGLVTPESRPATIEWLGVTVGMATAVVDVGTYEI